MVLMGKEQNRASDPEKTVKKGAYNDDFAKVYLDVVSKIQDIYRTKTTMTVK